MAVERWQQIEHLFHVALECPVAERDALLAQACAGDEALRREVKSLLTAHEKPNGFFASPPADLAADWLLLFRHVHNTETAFADLLQQLVRADDGAGTLRPGRVRPAHVTAKGLAVERALAFCVGFQKQGRLAAQLLVPGARLVQVGVPLLRRVSFHGGIEHGSEFFEINRHGRHSSFGPS